MMCEMMKEPRKTYIFILECVPVAKRAIITNDTTRIYFGIEHFLSLEMVNLESNWVWDWPMHPEIESYINEVSLCD